jgi:2-dehydropantoate 2-reductase
MLQDVSRRRRTEVDAITGALLDLAHRHGVIAPVNEVVFRLIKGLEFSYLAASDA